MGALHYLKIVLLLFIVMINISFSPALRNARGEENSVLEGYIKDAETNEPIPDVNVHIGTDGQDKETNTDLSGHYVFTVSAGSYHIDVGKEGYSDYHDWITIGENDRVWYNITLYKKPLENSTLKGYVINAQTGYPVVNAWVDVQAGTYRNGTSTWYNGYYELRTIAGTLTVRCGAHNYFDTETVVVMVENQTTWLNLTLYPAPPENSILKGYVLEYKTSLPVVDAFVYVNDRKQWDTGTYTIAAGYYEKSVIAGELWIVVSMSGYLSNKTKFSIAEFETKWLNITLYPELPENATLKGFVNDSFTGNVLSAELEVYGYGSWKKSTWSDYNGYYEMTVVPADLTLLVSAGQHAPNTTYFNITSDETKWLNISLERDELLPELTNITISINTNIGPNNPTQINGTIKEGYLRWGLVAFLEYLTEELGLKKYAFRTGYSTKEDGPLQLELLNLTLVQPGVYNFTLNWNATLPESGWLANETVKDYVGIDWYDAGRQVIEGSYYNATNPTPVDADAYFQRDGKLQKLRLYSGIELMPPFDPTGNFGARQQILIASYDFSYVQSVEEVYKYISVPNLTFMRTNEVPTGEYLVAFSAGDYGNNHGFNYSALLVDTTKPAVESISLLPESPVNASEVTFTITFTEAVNQSVELNVTFGLASPYTNHTINGAWQSSTTWVGAHLINNTTGDGVNTIRVANAVDQAKNIMDPDTSNTFIIDTIKPVADAGNDQTINQHVLVILNGSRSTDVNGSGIVNYTWKFTDVVLYTLYGEKVNYTFHNAGTYSITLTIKDAAGNLDIDTLTITVKDTTPPTVDYTPPELPQPKGKPIKIELTVTDNVEVANVTLYYRKLAEAKWKSLPMTKGAGDLWSGEIPAEYVTDDIFYYFVATDTSGNNVTEPPGGKEDPYKIGVAVVVPAEALDLRILGMIAVVIIVIVSLVGLVYYKHKKEKLLAKKPTIIDEVFLIYRDGRLIKHFTRRLKPIDDAILASMLVAVRDFVRDVFKGEPGVLEEMRFGELKFIIGMGKYIVIAAVILGPELELVKPQIAKAIKAIEQEHWSILERWDGDLDKVAPLSMYIEDLIAGKYK